ncbi:MAG: ABC transporter permease, partial [Zoogloeaceae bacterium]|nr:ABC transporter permease [Zoogloeaceae bacterium]
SASALLALPVIFLTGLAFAALGLVFTALSPSYDFFMYYFTLFITPMTLISGVFFPVDQLPGWLALIGQTLPLAQSVSLIRPLLAGQWPPHILFSIISLLAITLAAAALALTLLKRRLMR